MIDHDLQSLAKYSSAGPEEAREINESSYPKKKLIVTFIDPSLSEQQTQNVKQPISILADGL